MIHHIRNQHTDNGFTTYVPVTLPTIPGVEITTDRSETEPRQPVIRRAKQKRSPAGVALTAAAARRVEWVRQALLDIAEGEA